MKIILIFVVLIFLIMKTNSHSLKIKYVKTPLFRLVSVPIIPLKSRLIKKVISYNDLNPKIIRIVLYESFYKKLNKIASIIIEGLSIIPILPLFMIGLIFILSFFYIMNIYYIVFFLENNKK